MSVPGEVLTRYGLPAASWHALGNHGGFSGARLWRVEAGGDSFCLRAWPFRDPDPQRLRWLHHLMAAARAAGLTFVPRLITVGGTTFLEHGGQLWELTTWLPGRADFHHRPESARVRAACVALARVHRAWAEHSTTHGVCPAVVRRLDRANGWRSLVSSGWSPRFADGDPVRPLAEPAWQFMSVWVERVPVLLAPWTSRNLPLHPCLCDIWHDHVLFDGDAVSGMVDYGSTKLDHPSADLARLLGSLVGDDAPAWSVGLDAYCSIRPLSPDEQALARTLDRTGVIIGTANWLKWLYHDGREVEDRSLIAARLAALVRRLQSWTI
jgi:Ser/Thr protein kinase RdoA (MazF antagonist)